MISYGRQSVNEDDVAAVVEVLRSDWLTQGPAVARFETAVAEYCGAEHAVAVSSGTAALHLAALALGLEPGKLLWTTPNTFVSSAHCARYCGASVDFVDIDARSLNMDPAKLEAKLELAASQGRLPDLLLPVHFAGLPADMEAIGSLCRQFDVPVLEDAAHALGAHQAGRAIGACAHSRAAVFSFHPVKSITSGEGGMLLTQDAELAGKIRRLASLGVTRKPEQFRKPAAGPWYYEVLEAGYNFRLSDLHAALGASQMQRLDDFVRRREALARRYDQALAELDVVTPLAPEEVVSARHLYCLQFNGGTRVRDDVCQALIDAGIRPNLHYIPVHLQPLYADLGFRGGDFPVAEDYYSRCLTLPLYPDLTEAEQDQVIAVLKKVLD